MCIYIFKTISKYEYNNQPYDILLTSNICVLSYSNLSSNMHRSSTITDEPLNFDKSLGF